MTDVVKEPLLAIDECLNLFGHVVEDHGELSDVGVVLPEFFRDSRLQFTAREGPHGFVEFFERSGEASRQVPAHENDEKKRAGEREAERKVRQMLRQGGRILNANGEEKVVAVGRCDASDGVGQGAGGIGAEKRAELFQRAFGNFSP